MIEGSMPYPDYKESDQQWLGQIPSDWSLLPNRALFDEVKERDCPNEEMLSVTITRGVIRQQALLSDTTKRDSSNINKSAYKLVQPGDIAYNKMRAWQGALGASYFRGIVSPAYVVMRARAGVLPWFYHHLYRTPSFAKEAERWSYGITSDMWSLRPEHFKLIYSVQPSLDEQAAIVRFLDHANGKIERFIRAKRKLIGLLNEQKQAIIHRTVTRGLNPQVSLKSSDIPWLGDIPKHWEILRAKFLFRSTTRRDIKKDDPKLSVTQRRGIVPTNEMEENSTQARSYEHFQVCHPNDLVLNKYKAHLGVFCCAHQRGLITPNYTVFRPIRELHTSFFDLLFHTALYRATFSRIVYGVTEGMSPLYTQDFYQVPVVFPPASEQQEILNQLEVQTRQQSAVIARTEREIALMQEYRTRLTADVVTGKLDVRTAAAKLSEIGPEDPSAGETRANNESDTEEADE